eukprot:SAG11_NODE_1910_length_4079_cov_3.969095_7_plen_73_part_00
MALDGDAKAVFKPADDLDDAAGSAQYECIRRAALKLTVDLNSKHLGYFEPGSPSQSSGAPLGYFYILTVLSR